MTKRCIFNIDDVIWCFRDIARQKPASIFDNPFLKILKKAHDDNGMKVQLNVFYRTDFFYGNDEFSLAEMPDTYKHEFEEAADWLKMGFHSKQEFPDYPFINASYEDVKAILDDTKREVFRFAGPDSFAYGTVTHWLPMSEEGVLALRDGGIKIMSVSIGERRPYNGDPSSLPYGHAARLLQNRKPESELFDRGTRDVAIANSLCGYNHLPSEKIDPIKFKFEACLDEETGMYFKKFSNAICLNLTTLEQLPADFDEVLGNEYIGYGLHEQYFYPDYYAYQPDYADKIYLASKILKDNGYTYSFAENMVK